MSLKEYLELFTLEELKNILKKKNEINISNLSKNNLINTIIKKNSHNFDEDLINEPIISIYIYKILDLNNIDPYETKQKFNKFYPSNNNNGFIYPKSYIINNIEYNIDYKKFKKNRNNFYYSYDPLISFEPKKVFSFKNNYLYKNNLSEKIITSTNESKGGSLNELKNYYNFYLSKLTKVTSFINSGKKFYDNKKIIDIYNTINAAKVIVESYILEKGLYRSEGLRTITQKNNGAYIFNITSVNSEKIIIIGDIHGSYHTFLRLFVRLHLFGVINFTNYKINDEYKLIFLGDIMDRGQYSLEILYIITKFIINNNNNNILKIIINRGNHEDNNQWSREKYGFDKEINKKIPIIQLNTQNYNSNNSNYNSNNNNNRHKDINSKIKEKIMELLYNCPSAIILNYKNKKYWLCHGGFPIGSDDSYKFQVPSSKITFYPKLNNIPFQIRWADFYNNYNTNYTGIDNYGRPQIGLNKLKEFLIYNNIHFIIRGHSDNYKNAFLLKKPLSYIKQNTLDYILDINNEYIYDKNINNRDIKNIDNKIIFPTEISKNKYIDELIQCKGPTARLRINNWINNNNKNNTNVKILFSDDIQQDVYPVLTISSNSDLDRSLNNDSFIVLNFSYKNDFTKIDKKNIYNLFESINNNFSRNNEKNDENMDKYNWRSVNSK